MLDFLTSPRGVGLMRELEQADFSEANTLTLLTQLRQRYTPEEARAAVGMMRLRLRARDKFGDAASTMLFTDDALQQASDPQVRAYRAQRATGQTVLDLCCGIGADSLAFAEGAACVTGVDLDPLRVAMAQHNASALGHDNAAFLVADVTTYTPATPPDVIFFDPARRTDQGKRLLDVTAYLPPLATITRYHAPVKAVKLSPGVDLAQLQDYEAQVEFISVEGDLKEAVLWFGVEAPAATLLIEGQALHWSPEPDPAEATIAPPQRWLVEPDPALIRAGLVQAAALAYDGHMLDSTIAYFTTATPPITPWVRAWEIEDWMPFNLKKLRAYLRERGVGGVTVKKRGSPLTPEELIAKLKLKDGDERRTVVLTRHNDQPIVVICAEYPYNGGKLLK